MKKLVRAKSRPPLKTPEQPNPMITLRTIFKGTQFKVLAPKRTRGTPTVEITFFGTRYEVVFSLKRIVKGQTFLGLYPTAANLPKAENLNVGDYALLGSGEVIQIGK